MFGGVGLRMGSVSRRRRAVQWSSMAAQCSGGSASCRWLRPSLRSVLGFVSGAEWLTVNLVLRTAGPHLYLLRSATEACQPWMDWAPPIRARDQGPSGRWASLVGRSNQQYHIKRSHDAACLFSSSIKAMFSSQNFQDSLSHRMFGHIYRALNIDEKKLITQLVEYHKTNLLSLISL
jgi:hypothetical protein